MRSLTGPPIDNVFFGYRWPMPSYANDFDRCPAPVPRTWGILSLTLETPLVEGYVFVIGALWAALGEE